MSQSSKITVQEKIGYGLGDTASNFVFHIVNAFLISYYTDVLGLNPKAVGILYVAARVWDAVSDPLMGTLADRTQTKAGKYRPYLLWLAVPYGVIGFLAFLGPDFSDTGKLIYAYATYIALMTVYTAINVPYSALMGVMSADPKERASLSTFRFAGAFSAQVIIGLALIPLLNHYGGYSSPEAWRATIPFFAIVASVLFLITYMSTKERVPPQKGAQSVGKDFEALKKNTPLIVMLIVAVITLAQLGLRLGVTPFYLNYVTDFGPEKYWWYLDKSAIFWTSAPVALVLGLFMTKPMIKFFGKRNSLILLTALNALAIIVFYWIPPTDFKLILIVNMIGAFIAGPTPALVWAMYTDVVDYGEWKFGRRTTALAMSSAMLIQKIGLAIGGGMVGWMLGDYGFQANEVQTAEAVDGILKMFSVIPGVLLMSTAIVLLWYRLTDDEVTKITDELKERREQES